MEDDLQNNKEKKIDKLKEQMESLDYLETLVGRVQKYAKKLSSSPRSQLTSQQKLWLLAYSVIEKKLSAGTDASMVEFGRWLPILDESIT